MKLFDTVKQAMKLKVYLAGPDVFKPNPIQVGKDKKAILARVGLEGLFPMDPEIKDFAFNRQTALTIAEGNENLMNQSQVILVNMTPWHGPSMDVGTAFEAGYMSGRAKYQPNDVLIVGYYEGEWEQDFTKRVEEMYYAGKKLTHNEDGTVVDENGNSLEKFGLSENLMIPGAIHKTGGAIYQSFQEAVDNVQKLWEAKQDKLAVPVSTATAAY